VERQIYTQALRTALEGESDTHIGDLQMRSHPHALQVTITSEEAWANIDKRHISGLIILSPKQALLHTGATPEEWTAIMAAQEKAEEVNRVTSIHWKISTMGGALWAASNALTGDRREWVTGPDIDVKFTTTTSSILIQTSKTELTDRENTTQQLLQFLRQWDTNITETAPNQTNPTPGLSIRLDRQQQWQGSYVYTASTLPLAKQIYEQVNHTCLPTRNSLGRMTATSHQETNGLTLPSPSATSKNGKEGRYSGPLSSFQ
jgi:hypothetical protein